MSVLRRSILLAILLLGVPACARVSSRPATGSAAATSVPPLVAHQWSQSEPLITLGYLPADAGCGFDAQLPAEFTLLPDGRLFTLEAPAENGARAIKSATLSLADTCRLLNAVDQAGFFDYDPATYIRNPDQWTPPVLWAPTNTISVTAWRSKSVRLYWLDGFIDGGDQMRRDWQKSCPNCPPTDFPTILPALRDTYMLLSAYEPDYSQVYQWERLGVWMDASAQNGDAVEWPLDSFPASVPPVTRTGAQPGLVLSGAQATAVYDLFRWRIDTCGMTVKRGEDYYRAFARPLLPNEYTTALPAVSLSCSPADGLMELP